ncbi:hypothetical protein CH306_27410 [Rhodococcus sp. 15-725-2-2b]|uniref:hypothetical protein n=1 Tax=unclassified Rhodococcus (in: high G+C Gram-positive bacteria) TaxID=192944 RepID=UPI000B9BB888|nr:MULTISPECIES: hypothetical protein [unclassified Rhodococcus (in: high G+C Gram-positive bacteria)]OZC60596.1 hypothetical protein CH277_28185 [Rhodococcus sp. 06-469-3-2]OZD40879.1 hypothetical protein CH264_24735 [Rhodococcus sp. 06-1477-1A]OZE01634.1 hypothetical protein CH250_26570 [Rhodococcus sp. 05-2255-3C]OZE12090.1 hypothetical protein CH249_09290 [Rhodococcus sp. 05-2255-3B1]OZE17158.1 hypothetical protein CH255_18940 [Rhodococcus sp. 05-2255-2A2]
MNPLSTFRDHRRIRQEFLSDDSEENAARYFESANTMDGLRIGLNRFAAVVVGILGIAAAAYNVKMGFDGSDVSIIELLFPALAVALVFALVRIGNDLGSKGTKEIVATANRAKFIGDQRRASASDR